MFNKWIASPGLAIWKYPGMLATQDSPWEGRDDEAKMAARLRELPLRGQEILKERMKTTHDKALRGDKWIVCFLLFQAKLLIARE